MTFLNTFHDGCPHRVHRQMTKILESHARFGERERKLRREYRWTTLLTAKERATYLRAMNALGGVSVDQDVRAMAFAQAMPEPAESLDRKSVV